MEVKVNYELEKVEKNRVNNYHEEISTYDPNDLILKGYDYAVVSEHIGRSPNRMKITPKNDTGSILVTAKDLDELLRYAILGHRMFDMWMSNAEGIDIIKLNSWKDGERSLKESDVNYFNWKMLMPERD